MDKPSKKVRVIVYAVTGLINIASIYLATKGLIGDAEVTALASLNTLVLVLAGVNVKGLKS